MSTAVLTPNTATATGTPLLSSGAFSSAAACAVLTDSSNTTWVSLDAGDGITLAFTDLTLPTGAFVSYAFVLLTDGKYYTNCPVIVQLSAGQTATWGGVVTWGQINAGTGNIDGAQAHLTAGIGVAPTFTARRALTDGEVDGVTCSIGQTGTLPYLISAASLLVQYIVKPVVVVSDPTGTLGTDNSPAVRWTTTFDQHSQGSAYYEVRIFTSAVAGGGGFNPSTSTAVDESGIVTGTPPLSGASYSWQGTATLTNGSYVAYVRHADTGYDTDKLTVEPHWSDWTSHSFSVSVPAPGTPTIAATSQSTSARVRLVFTAAGTVTTDTYEIQTSLAGAADWRELRTDLGDGLTVAGTVYDYENPNGQSTDYRVRALHTYATGSYGYSNWATVTSSWTSVDWWLKNPYDPTLNMPARLRSQPSRTRAGRNSVQQPLGRENPVVVGDITGGWTGEVVFRSTTNAARGSLFDVSADNVPLLLQAPANSPQWDDTWLVLGDLTQERVIDSDVVSTYSFDGANWTEVDRP